MEKNKIEITRELAERCAYALVNGYNNDYDEMGAASKLDNFRKLLENLKMLDYAWMMVYAKGESDMRDLAFNWTTKKAIAYCKKHHIGNYA